MQMFDFAVYSMPSEMLCCLQMLHEQLRTYKRELYETQAANTAHDRRVLRLQGEVKRLHAALQASLQALSFCK